MAVEQRELIVQRHLPELTGVHRCPLRCEIAEAQELNDFDGACVTCAERAG